MMYTPQSCKRIMFLNSPNSMLALLYMHVLRCDVMLTANAACEGYDHPVQCDCNISSSSNISTNPVSSSARPRDETCEWQSIPISYCLSFNATTCTSTAGACPYTLQLSQRLRPDTIGYLKVQVSNCSSINEVVCEPLKRTGLLCSKCKFGYGLALYARSWECVWCGEEGGGGGGGMAWRWGLYLLLELLPLLVFYLLVVLLDMQAATPPYTSYVFFCQLFTQLFRSSPYIRMHFELHSHRTLRLLSLTVLDVWSLDFLRRVLPPFCVSSQVSQVEAISLEFACALFPLLLVVGTYLVIELHARDVRVVVYCWRPFHRLCTCLRRSWNPQASIIHAFATFLLLSLSKLIFLLLYTLDVIEIFYSNAPGKTDFNFFIAPEKRLESVPGVAACLFVLLLIFSVLPALLIVLYPQKCLRRLKCCQPLYRSQSLWTLMEAFQGHYKGGTSGTCSYRFSAVLHFSNRVAVSLVLVNLWFRVDPPATQYHHIIAIYLVGVSAFYSLARPYAKSYMNNIEGFLYALAAVLTLDIVSLSLNLQPRLVGNVHVHANILLVVMVMPTLVLVVAVVCRLLWRLVAAARGRAWRGGGVAKEEKSEESDGLPHRLQNESTPLVSALVT